MYLSLSWTKMLAQHGIRVGYLCHPFQKKSVKSKVFCEKECAVVRMDMLEILIINVKEMYIYQLIWDKSPNQENYLTPFLITNFQIMKIYTSWGYILSFLLCFFTSKLVLSSSKCKRSTKGKKELWILQFFAHSYESLDLLRA